PALSGRNCANTPSWMGCVALLNAARCPCQESGALSFGVQFQLAVAVRVSVSASAGDDGFGSDSTSRAFARADTRAADLFVFLGIGPEERAHAAAQAREGVTHRFAELIALGQFCAQLNFVLRNFIHDLLKRGLRFFELRGVCFVELNFRMLLPEFQGRL